MMHSSEPVYGLYGNHSTTIHKDYDELACRVEFTLGCHICKSYTRYSTTLQNAGLPVDDLGFITKICHDWVVSDFKKDFVPNCEEQRKINICRTVTEE
jgi:hypothetical protein